jgi:formate C-acetyltransferase
MFKEPVYHVTYSDRVKKLREMLGNKDTEIDLNRARAEMEVLEKYKDAPRVIQRARILENLLERKEIQIYDGELIVGTVTDKVRASYISGQLMAGTLDRELDDPERDPSVRKYDRHIISDDERKELRETIIPYFRGKTLEEHTFGLVDDETKEKGFITQSSCAHIPSYADVLLWQDAGHCVPNHEKVLAIGLNGIKKEVEWYLEKQKQPYSHFGTKKKTEFYEACLITLDAALAFAKRYSDYAKELAEKETDEKRKKELIRISENCARVPAEPARDWWEALQSIWMINVILNCEQFNFGVGMMARFDQYMLPFYEASKKNGETDDELLEQLECFYVKTASFTEFLDSFSATQQTGYPMGQTINIGGELPGGGDGCNIVTWAVMEADEHVGLFQPDIGFRIWDGTPEIFLKKAMKNLALGHSKPKFYGEKVCMEEWGKKYTDMTEEELHECIWIGCQELQAPYISQNHAFSGVCNMSKVLEMTLHNGKCAVCGRQMGPQTGDPRTFESMEQFKQALRTQIFYWTKNLCKAVKYEIDGLKWMAAPFTSCLYEGPLEQGKDAMEGGCWITEYGLNAGAVTDTGDSLVVIDKLVYRDKKVTWDELLTALDANFEGYEDLRQMCINNVPKFGNDNIYADSFSAFVLDSWCDAIDYVNTQKELLPEIGGYFTSGTINGNSHIGLGAGVAALPSGRLSGTPTADTTSPVVGMDTEGAVAVLNSMSHLPIQRLTVGAALNQRLDPCLFEGDENIDRMVAYLRTVNDDYVEHIQFNVVSSETLRAAQKEPDKYRDLIVRVATYCSYFTELSPETQEQIIMRSEHTQF